MFLEELDKRLALGGVLVQSFFEENDAGEIVEGVWGSEEELAKSLAVGLDVFNVDAGQPLSNGSGALICS